MAKRIGDASLMVVSDHETPRAISPVKQKPELKARSRAAQLTRHIQRHSGRRDASPHRQAARRCAFHACYVYPEPAGFRSTRVRPDAAFFSETLGEFVLQYDAVWTSTQSDQALLESLHSNRGGRSRRRQMGPECAGMCTRQTRVVRVASLSLSP